MRPDFSLIWGADNAPFTPIEASDYTAGWVFRTGAPPRRVNFDYFQNLSDQRTAWLGEQMLLAVGHEWQDDVTYDAYAVVRSPVNGQLYRSLVGSNLNNEPSVSGAQWALDVDTLNAPIATVAAAGTINLTTGAPDTSRIAISGTGVSINGFTVAPNRLFVVKMTGASNTLVNSASLVTGRGTNIPVVAGDSFLMRSTTANTVEIVGGSFLIDRGIGSGQTWRDVTASRVLNTTYTNTTGQTIGVFAYKTLGTALDIKVDGVIADAAFSTAPATNIGVSALVPPGSTYKVKAESGSLLIWSELRA